MKLKYLRENKGITLLALVITIVVLLILAGITIGALSGNNSIIDQAGNAKISAESAEEREIVEISATQAMGDSKNADVEEEYLEKYLQKNAGGREFQIFEEEGDFIVAFKERSYRVDNDGNVEKYVLIVDNSPGDITKDKDGNALDGIEKPFEIWSIEDLVAFSNMTGGTGYILKDGVATAVTAANAMQGKTVKLKKNLNFNSGTSYLNSKRTDFGDINGVADDGNELKTEMTTGKGFNPIKNFKGSFDGENHEIRNIHIDTDQNAALFVGGTIPLIKNVGITGKITSSAQQVAAVVVNASVTLIDNCWNKAEITGGSGTSWIAGICGRVGSVRITNCHNEGTITDNISNVGSAGGINSDLRGEFTQIENCYNTGNVTGKNYAGGITAQGGKKTIKNSYNTGNVIAGSQAGGIVGTGAALIENCFNKGEIKGGDYAGGISTSSEEIYNCYNKGDVLSGHRGGLVHSVSSKMINCYNVGNLEAANSGTGGLVNTIKGQEVVIANCFNTASTQSSFSAKAGGIINYNSGSTKLYNCYSIAEKHTQMYRGNPYWKIPYGLITTNEGTVTLSKCYYLKTETITRAMVGIEDTELDVTALNSKSDITAAILNANRSSVPDVGKTLVEWKDGPDGYPILDFSKVEGYPVEK